MTSSFTAELEFYAVHSVYCYSVIQFWSMRKINITKRHKKSIAFRERKARNKVAAEEPDDIPEPEIQDEPENTNDEPGLKHSIECGSTVPEPKLESRKRKRHSDDVQEVVKYPENTAARKNSKKSKTEGNQSNPKVDGLADEISDAKSKRFILFVGE